MASFRGKCIIYVLLVLLFRNDFQPIGAAPHQPSHDSGEEVLENFIEESLMQLDDARTGHLEEHLSDNVDTVAHFLNLGTDQSEALQDAIAQAVQLDELLEEDEVTTTNPPITFTPTKNRHFQPPSGRPGLLGLLEPEEHNPHIVHAKRVTDFDKLLATTQDLLHTLPRGERNFLEQVSQEVDSLEANGGEIDLEKVGTEIKPRGSPMRGLMRLAASVWQRGTDMLDRFYQAPEFIMKMPILGEHLTELKRKGEPLYKAIKFVRHSIYLLKFMPLNPNRECVKNLSKADRKRVEEAKKMISEAGAMALKSVAFKIVARYAHKAVSEEALQEFVTRTFYAILGKVLTAGK